MSVPLVEVVRSGFRECVHRGSVALWAAGALSARSVGEVDVPMFPRSSNKPFQALGMLRCGLELSDADLAVACASHSGEPEHLRRVESVLHAHGLTEDDLQCPAALPGDEASRHAMLRAGHGPRRLAMNCSGKHAAMLATCVRAGWSTEDYREPSHPLQVEIRRTIEESTGEPAAATAVDGCGAPLAAFSLAGLARAFAGLVQAPVGTPRRRVADVMRRHPFLVSGTGREDESMMTAVPGLLSKAGAEGVAAVALPDGRAAAIKIEDGHARARLPVLVGALRELGVAPSEALDALATEPVFGAGRRVGDVRMLPDVFDRAVALS
ncbi:L-asparaginase II [Actinoalloteichus hoggarensis]|uniref:L-asparaginase II n=1 Tax=Actinoalloteichus hoggarensis TaxID=1470176 RepID=A0A221WCJ1_9PSEU|nr:asparaginase [Actinoalloteichus hoggarensis]ASO22987.1 L-asparaginase II [Actinoalloteichus hoggarensis]MBB5922592.1 L-asparaginase II [Actinoalloteichus hoggarensis]